MIPVTTIVWATFQSPGVKVILDTAKVPSVVSDELTGITTSLVGSDVSTIVNVAGAPDSVVVPDIDDATIPATLSSVLTTIRSCTSMVL